MEKKNKTIRRKETPVKLRDGNCYSNKVAEVTHWYNELLENRKTEPKINPHNNLPYKRAELKDLQFYLDKIKKVVS